jgi:hypothetical protein
MEPLKHPPLTIFLTKISNILIITNVEVEFLGLKIKIRRCMPLKKTEHLKSEQLHDN